jgi:hypothetical protein
VVHGVLGQGGDPERNNNKKHYKQRENRWHNIFTWHPNTALGNPRAGKKYDRHPLNWEIVILVLEIYSRMCSAALFPVQHPSPKMAYSAGLLHSDSD